MGREMERSGAKHLHRERERGRMKTEKRANNRGCPLLIFPGGRGVTSVLTAVTIKRAIYSHQKRVFLSYGGGSSPLERQQRSHKRASNH
jgi:hypothetical protein